MQHGKVKYILENYNRAEGKDEGQVLAYAIVSPHFLAHAMLVRLS